MRSLRALSLLVALVVAYVGGASPFTAWNLLPVGLVFAATFLLSKVESQGTRLRRVAIAFSLGVLAVVALSHLAWLFDWGGTATGSSTGGLIFIFIPFWAGIVGVVTAGVFLLAERLIFRSSPS